MPHDIYGNLLQVGDEVIVRCKVEMITTGEEYCNVTVKTLQPMYPGEYTTQITLNTRQTERVPAYPGELTGTPVPCIDTTSGQS